MMASEWSSLSGSIHQRLHSSSIDGDAIGSFRSSDPRMRIPLRSFSEMQQRNNNSSSSHLDGPLSSTATLLEYDSKRPQLTEETLENTLRILNEELNLLGFPSVFTMSNSTLHLDVASLASAAYEVVTLYQQSLRKRENLETQLKRAESDLEHHQRVQKRLQSNIDESEKLIRLCQEKERQSNQKVKQLTTSLKKDREEIRRLKLDLSHSQSQYRHERNKMEREVSSLRERLHTVMTNQRSSPPHMDLLNCLQRLDGKRRTWARPKGDGLMGEKSKDDLHQYTLRQMEAKQEEMLLENKDLRRCIFRMQRRLDSLVTVEGDPGSLSDDGGEACSDRGGMRDTRGDPAAGLDQDGLWGDDFETKEGGIFHLPYDLMRENVEKNLQEKVELLRTLIAEKSSRKDSEDQLNGKSTSDDDLRQKSPGRPEANVAVTTRYWEEVEQLKKQISQYEKVIENQEKMLKQQTSLGLDNTEGIITAKALVHTFRKPSSDLTNDFLKDKDLLESQHRLAEERRTFYEQKAEFEKEKTNFSEAAMHLCRERKTLDDEKANFLRQQLMLLTPGSRARPPTGGAGRRNSIATTSLNLTPSRSSFTPAPPAARTDAADLTFIGFPNDDISSTITESSHGATAMDTISSEHNPHVENIPMSPKNP